MAAWPVIDLDTVGQPNFVLLISLCDRQTADRFGGDWKRVKVIGAKACASFHYFSLVQ